MKKTFFLVGLVVAMVLSNATVMATPHDLFPLSGPTQQQQFSRLTNEVRCLVCQNQSIADSNAPIAKDLKQKVYELVREGQSDAAIKQFLVERYGEFVLFKPRVTVSTIVLWLAPLLFLLIGLGVVVRRLVVTSRQNNDAS